MTQPPILPVEQQPAAQHSQTRAGKQSSLQSLLENKLAVLSMLFLVTGALGIPVLWMSPKFSTFERWLWTILNSIYTAGLIWIVVQICLWSWRRISGI